MGSVSRRTRIGASADADADADADAEPARIQVEFAERSTIAHAGCPGGGLESPSAVLPLLYHPGPDTWRCWAAWNGEKYVMPSYLT